MHIHQTPVVDANIAQKTHVDSGAAAVHVVVLSARSFAVHVVKVPKSLRCGW